MYESLITPPSTPVRADTSSAGPSPIDAALAAEGVTGRAADFVRSIYQQESGSGKNTATSNAGAVGAMQVIPSTFKSVADKDWDITNPEQNLRAGIRYANRGFEASGGNPVLAGAYYYGGPGGMAKAAKGVAVSDPRNPNAPNTLQYGQQVAARMGSPMARQQNQYYTPVRGEYASLITPPPDRGFGGAAADVGLSLGQGVAGAFKSMSDLAGAGNPVSETLEDASKFLQEKKSEQSKATLANSEQRVKDAEAAGDWKEEVGAYMQMLWDQPAELIAQGVGSFATLGVGKIAQAAKLASAAKSAGMTKEAFFKTKEGVEAIKAASDVGFRTNIGVSAAQGVGSVKGSQYEQTFKSAKAQGMSDEEAEALATEAQSYGGSGAGQQILGGALGAGAAAVGPIERVIAGKGVLKPASGVPMSAGKGFAVEGGTDGGQGAQNRYAGNSAAIDAGVLDESRRYQGVAGQFAMEGAIGGVLGAGGGAAESLTAPKPDLVVPPELKAVADKAAQGGTLSKAAMAGQSGVVQPEPVVDPVARLAELESIGADTPGAPARAFTAQELTEYKELTGLRDATPGMDPAAQKSDVDDILDRARSIEEATRTNNGLSAFRQEDSPVTASQFLNDLAIAKSKSSNAAQREQALTRLEFAADWAGFNIGAAPQKTEAAGPPSRTNQIMGMAANVTPQDRSDVVAAIASYRNPRLPAATREAALGQALEIVGRYQAATMPSQAGGMTPAVLGDIPPAVNTPEFFLREADRRESGAFQFKELGFTDEANALQAEADSLREKAASARAGELGQELTAEEPVSTASPIIQQTVAQATEGLPRLPIAPLAEGEAPTGANTAQRRKRQGQVAQLVGIGFETVERRGKDFFLINAKTKQEVKLDGMADAQLARAAITKMVNDRANTAAASPQNDRPEPTAAQIEAGNYKKSDVIDLNGMKITIENPAGSVRRGVSPEGKAWESTMAHHYGEFLGTEGADGDRLDVFIGPRPDGNKVFVIDQVNPDGSFDEHKVIMGATSEEQARAIYLANYEKGWTGLGAIAEMPVGDFKAWAKSERVKQPLTLGKQDKLFTVTDGGNPVQLMKLDTSEVGDASAPRAGKGRAIAKKDADLVKAVGAIFGMNVQFFRPMDSSFTADGFVRLEDKRTIYLNERTTISPLAVFGHEFMHLIKLQNPLAYASMSKVVRALVKNPSGYRADYYGKDSEQAKSTEPLNDAELEELMSDLNGNFMTDSKFWGQVFTQIQKDHGKEARSIIAKLSAFLTKSIDLLVNSLKGQNFNAGNFVNDTKAVRAAFKDGLVQYAKEAGIGQAAVQAEVLRQQQKIKGVDIKREDVKLSPPRPTDGLTLEGYHFSQRPRSILSTGLFGTGLKGSARDQILASPDKRIKERLSFYVDKGTGIRPEAGVGGIAHKATLTNIYDADADTLRLKGGDARVFESKVLDAGYSGYLNRMDGNQPGQAILLGAQTIEPEVLGPRTSIEGAKTAPAAAARGMDLGDKIAANKTLPMGQVSPTRWSQILMMQMPQEAAQLMDLAALGDAPLYKDELIAKIRTLQPQIKRSTQRAQDEYAAVEAKYKGTASWMKAPNGQPTALNERQWVQVRTPSFQAWFGPWEKYAAEGNTVWSDETGEVSKVVDANGEPLVVYHGTDKGGFMQFRAPTGSKRGDLGIFTTSNEEMADSYVRKGSAGRIEAPTTPETKDDLTKLGYKLRSSFNDLTDESEFYYIDPDGNEGDVYESEEEATQDVLDNMDEGGVKSGVYALFMNLRNPQEENFEGANWGGERTEQWTVNIGNEPYTDPLTGKMYFSEQEAREIAKEFAAPDDEYEGADYLQAAEDLDQTTDDVVREAIKFKSDGAIVLQVMDDGGGLSMYANEPSDIFVAFDPNNVKSADFNGGEFSTKSDDIRKSLDRSVTFDDPEQRLEVSTAQPTAKPNRKTGYQPNSYTEKRVIDFEDVKASKKHLDQIVAALRNYNTLSGRGNANQLLQELRDTVKENLIWLHDHVKPEARNRAKLWYDGANRIANDWIDKFGINLRQAGGILAVFSPQMDWFKNVSLAERALTILKDHGNEQWSDGMTRWAESWLAASTTIATKSSRMGDVKVMRAIAASGKTLSEMTPEEAAYFVRAFDEAYYPRSYRLITPEGGFGDFVEKGVDQDSETNDNEEIPTDPSLKTASVTWGSFGTIEKAVEIYRNGSFRTADIELGGEHKVRNFYNNIVAPNSADGHVTIDTHAVAAALMKALSGTSDEVMHNLGGLGSTASTGASGSYALFADAYREAAAERGILAREMQSITWEAIRSLFPANLKKGLSDKVSAVWDRVRAGELTREEARQEILGMSKAVGGDKAFAWEGGGAGAFAKNGATSFDSAVAADPADREVRTMPKQDVKEKISVSLSSATKGIPGVASLYLKAMRGDDYAHALLQDIAADNLTHLLEGTTARIEAKPSTGLYGGSIEPSLSLQVSFTDEDKPIVLAALAKFAGNFNQEQVHVRQSTKDKVGTEYDDGSYATPVYRWGLTKALKTSAIQRVIDKSGLYGLTVGDDFIEVYYVGDIKNAEQREAFNESIATADKLLGKATSGIGRAVARLWPYGYGDGAIGYERIRGDVAAGPAASSKTAKRVAEYLNQVDGKPGRVKTFTQQDKLTPEQDRLQSEIADVYESLPDNDLKNPRVRKAYAELAKEVLRQYAVLPIQVEMMIGAGEPYKNSNAMRRDILDNNHLSVFATTPDTFGPPGESFAGHPLLEDSGLKDQNGQPMLFNDLFRAVHDYYAHAMAPTQFGPLGEEAAWKNHMSMTRNPWARWALTIETRGQNSYVNFNRDLDRSTPISQRSFAPQKTALLPVSYSLTGNAKVDRMMKEFIKELPETQQQGTKPKPPPPVYADEVEASKAKGRKVTQVVEIEETGKTGKLSVDGGKTLDDYNQRVAAMQQLLECLRK